LRNTSLLQKLSTTHIGCPLYTRKSAAQDVMSTVSNTDRKELKLILIPKPVFFATVEERAGKKK
jgi:hypothetical protein